MMSWKHLNTMPKVCDKNIEEFDTIKSSADNEQYHNHASQDKNDAKFGKVSANSNENSVTMSLAGSISLGM